MIEAIVSGVLLGGVLALLVGPVFFMLIHTSVKKGFFPAMMLSLGVIASDALFASITYLGSSTIANLKEMNSMIGITGGLLVIGFGIANLFKKPVVNAEQLDYRSTARGTMLELAKGFSMNSLNPSVLFFWIGVAGTWSIQDVEGKHTALFYSSALATVFCTDLLKAWGACSIKKAVSSNFLIWMNRISGVILIGFGLAMIIKFMYIS
ncbi:MAG: LysE family translocator [Bacteroidota bacterium]